MTRIARARELIGKPVLTLDQATYAGEVRDVLIDPYSSRMIGFTVRGRGLLSPPLVGMLPAGMIAAIGRDAVMISTFDVLVDESEGADTMLAEQDDVIGKEAVSAAGASLGKVSDVILELRGGTATVVGYELAAHSGQSLIVPMPEGVAVSGDALVVPQDAEGRAATGLASFRDALERTRG
ncbi:hypothetical protein BH24CHL5_BH24CHL5_03020 [soil metagenome]